MTKKNIILHILTSLDVGGAELMLLNLLRNLDTTRFDNHVISLVSPGRIAKKIKELGIQVDTLGLTSGVLSIPSIMRLNEVIRRVNPAVIHSWLYHADFLGGVTGALLRKPVIWAVHNTSLDPKYVKRSTILIAKINALLSKYIPRKIVFVSETSYRIHAQFGFNRDKSVVIPNGFDTSVFFPDQPSGIKIREEFEIESDAFLIGLIARFDPLKDHHSFIKAADILLKQYPNVHFLLCGRDITYDNTELNSWISEIKLKSNIHLLGDRNDIPSIMNALDIHTLSSIGEAFPIVIGEAMACGVPNVATDVGDIAYLVGETGVIVPPKDPLALAKGWMKMINLEAKERQKMGDRAYKRIEDQFNIVNITGQYEILYQSIINQDLQ